MKPDVQGKQVVGKKVAVAVAAGLALLLGMAACSDGTPSKQGVAAAGPSAIAAAGMSETDRPAEGAFPPAAGPDSKVTVGTRPPQTDQPAAESEAKPTQTGKPQSPEQVGPDRDLVRTATWTLHAPVPPTGDQEADKAAARAQAEELAAKVRAAGIGAGGHVSFAEGTGTVQVVTLRVPVANYDTVRTAIAALGNLTGSETVEDVTGALVDLTSRIKNMRSSLDRVRALLGEAKSLKDIILLESELTRREADLEVLLGREKSLTSQSSLSTMTVTISARVEERSAASSAEADSGFLAGLKAGWHVAQRLGTALAMVVGAALPWLPLVLVVVLGMWWLIRRQRRARLTAPRYSEQGVGYPTDPGAAN